MIGQQSVTAFLYAVGLIPLMIAFAGPTHIFVKIMIFCSILITIMALGWILYLISHNRLSPFINRISPEDEVVWLRITKNNMFAPQVVKKGVYGQTKGVIHGKKADVIDKGDYTVNLINGNKAIIVMDMLSHNVNLEHAAAWKKIFDKNNVGSAKEAYEKTKTKKKLRFTLKPKGEGKDA